MKGGVRGDAETYLKNVQRWEQTDITAALDAVERGYNIVLPAPQGAHMEVEPKQFIDPLPKFPQSLKDKPNWVRWKIASVNGKLTKVPYRMDGSKAASTRPEDWTDFKSAVTGTTIDEKGGIGFVVTKADRLIGIDLDGCRNPQTGEISRWAMIIIDAFRSYSEVTPSQTGARLWLIGDMPKDIDKVYNLDPEIGHGAKVKIEIYSEL